MVDRLNYLPLRKAYEKTEDDCRGRTTLQNPASAPCAQETSTSITDKDTLVAKKRLVCLYLYYTSIKKLCGGFLLQTDMDWIRKMKYLEQRCDDLESL